LGGGGVSGISVIISSVEFPEYSAELSEEIIPKARGNYALHFSE
jgi:hypothetical protein